MTKIQKTDIHSYSFSLQNNFELLEGGVLLGNVKTILKQYGNTVSKYINISDITSDGFLLYVPANAMALAPIHVTCLFNKSVDLQNFIIAETGSSAQLMVSYQSKNNSQKLRVNDTTNVIMCATASLDFARLQNNDIQLNAQTNVRQAAHSSMKTHFVTMSAQKVYNKLKVYLDGIKAEHSVYGLSLTRQSEHVDNDVEIIHASADCQSTQLFKHILSDVSTGMFTGRIIVNKDSQKTVAYQRSSNILINPKAKMNMRPQLEIYADDVKCSHGATTGQLDAEAIFYLRSRGISEKRAKKILLQAFADEVIDNMTCKPFKKITTQNLKIS